MVTLFQYVKLSKQKDDLKSQCDITIKASRDEVSSLENSLSMAKQEHQGTISKLKELYDGKQRKSDTRVVELERLLQGERDEKSSDKRTLGEVTQQLEESRSAKLQLENDLAQLKNDLARAREDLGAVTKVKEELSQQVASKDADIQSCKSRESQLTGQLNDAINKARQVHQPLKQVVPVAAQPVIINPQVPGQQQNQLQR